MRKMARQICVIPFWTQFKEAGGDKAGISNEQGVST